MSIKALSLAWEYGPADPLQLLVLISIADDGDNDGEGHCVIDETSFPGIAKRSRMTPDAALAMFHSLVRDGWLIETPKHSIATHRIDLARLEALERADPDSYMFVGGGVL